MSTLIIIERTKFFLQVEFSGNPERAHLFQKALGKNSAT